MIYREAVMLMELTTEDIFAIGNYVLANIKGASEFCTEGVLVKTGKYKPGVKYS